MLDSLYSGEDTQCTLGQGKHLVLSGVDFDGRNEADPFSNPINQPRAIG